MQEISLINFTDLNEQERMMILAWRNDERVAKFMKNRSVSQEEHLKFIESLKERGDKRYFLVKEGEIYIGVIDFIDITKDSCEFGIYANPKLKGKGQILMQTIIDYATKALKIKELKSCAYNENEKATNLYRKFGFEIYDKNEQMSYMSLYLNLA
ncbi:UDP-4-amino-4,6-dideoxy-N-acetyl-beta-L-altrosamine N-acetyltransferase [Campylobacter sp. 7477a]|uniref:UDP-4-amino-4, 6-dideoxy-N-acetyl-beta-L-altrosamine N-acetyltransferase n=1 Tax=Campylobacter sp. 7477a TaxID=2735741 RepID=UPI003014D322|nr:UDP-4-amino-4,6-dideoxy-N-acetyl-beta-L-altrosamine N-acetyltransferase [Campylobacter sp. 7477a]